MQQTLDVTRTSRKHFSNAGGYTLEQLNKIPKDTTIT
jgi:hypothetical protein